MSSEKKTLRMVVPFDEVVPLAMEMNGCRCMLYITDSKGNRKEIAVDGIKELSIVPAEENSAKGK